MLRIPTLLVCLSLLSLSWSSAGRAAPKEGATFKDWVVRCEVLDAAGEPKGRATGTTRKTCFIVQNLVLKDKNQRVLLVAVAHAPDRQSPVAVFTLPLGIFLPAGVALSIDGAPARRYQVQRCVASGCKLQILLEPPLLKQFRDGIKAEVTIRDGQGTPITLPVSLRGFTAALQSLR